MMLFESPDFEDAIKAAQNYFKNLGLTEQFIEKDYYVTEAAANCSTSCLYTKIRTTTLLV